MMTKNEMAVVALREFANQIAEGKVDVRSLSISDFGIRGGCYRLKILGETKFPDDKK